MHEKEIKLDEVDMSSKSIYFLVFAVLNPSACSVHIVINEVPLHTSFSKQFQYFSFFSSRYFYYRFIF